MRTILFFILTIPLFGLSQNIDDLFITKGEVYFSFEYKNKHQLNKLSKIISIDHETNADIAYAYANKTEFENFLKQGVQYKIVEVVKSLIEVLEIQDYKKRALKFYSTDKK